ELPVERVRDHLEEFFEGGPCALPVLPAGDVAVQIKTTHQIVGREPLSTYFCARARIWSPWFTVLLRTLICRERSEPPAPTVLARHRGAVDQGVHAAVAPDHDLAREEALVDRPRIAERVVDEDRVVRGLPGRGDRDVILRLEEGPSGEPELRPVGPLDRVADL